MEYNQENIDQVRSLLPLNSIRDIAKQTGLNYSTVRDSLNYARTRTGKRNLNRKQKILDAAIGLLESKGIKIN